MFSTREAEITEFKEIDFSKPTLLQTIWAPSKQLNISHKILIEVSNKLDLNLVIIINRPALFDEDNQYLSKRINTLIVRENTAFDFGGYKIGRDYLMKKDIPEEFNSNKIMINNDSTYIASSKNLTSVIERIISLKDSYGGLTDSFDTKYHLHSNLLFYTYKLFFSSTLDKIYERLMFTSDPAFIIRNYETQMTAFIFAELNESPKVLYPIHDLLSHNIVSKVNDYYNIYGPNFSRLYSHFIFECSKLISLNSTHFLWLELLYVGYPFIKRDLILENPSNVPLVGMMKLAMDWLKTDVPYEDLKKDFLAYSAARERIYTMK